MLDIRKPIIVVDDEPGTCEFIKAFLEDRGYTVFAGHNGQEGLDLIREKSPELILLDIKMPVMDGIEALGILRENDQVTKVVIITGVEDGDQIEQAKLLGVSCVLKKPLQLMELAKVLLEI